MKQISYLQVLSLLLQLFSCQTPTAQWYFDTTTTTTYTNNIYNSGNPPFYLDDNGSNIGSSNARYVKNGMYFEGYNLACTHAPASTTIRCDTNFSVDFWPYINILNVQSVLVCRFWHKTGSAPNERFCIGYDTNGQLIVRINQNGYNQSNNRITLSISNCQYALGWNHVTVTFKVSGTSSTAINCYIQTDSGLSTTGSYTWGSYINDDPSNGGYLCSGGTVALGFGGGTGGGFNSIYTGMINMISFYYSITLTSAQVAALYSTNCQGYCKVCQIRGTAPYKCLQQKAGYYQKYDFTLTTYPVSQTHPDTSGYSFNLAVNTNFAFTPAYVSLEGIWFDTTFGSTNQYLYSTGSTLLATNINSFTIESWIRPIVTPTSSMNIYEKEVSAGTDYLRWGFGGGTSLSFTMSGSTASFTTGTISLNVWHYIVVKVVETSSTASRVCQKMDTVTQSCSNMNKVFTESGTSLTQIGDGFRGYMMNLYVYDYAKEELDMTKMVQTTGCTKNANGNTCTNCPFATGQCNVDCGYGNYVNTTTVSCTPCYASCRTCWGAYGNTCFSCLKTPTTWKFDYVNKCKTACGDGIRDDYEKCDDGNTVSGDGCSSTCLVETGFACEGGSFNTSDTCYNLCGDGIPTGKGCDDGNLVDGDGCDSHCDIETGWTCSGTPSTCTTKCGDGLRVGTEKCDDGNTVSGDGCSSSCMIETGYNCTGGSVDSKDTCQEKCGDGLNFGKYKCDDGNNVNFDGCDQNCRIEVGYTCSGGSSTTKDTCKEICGDARDFHTFANECDDGNIVNGDGCSSACLIETGFKCKSGSAYTEDTCYEICGDGLNMGHVQCDDGNVISGDGCHSDCTVEIGWSCSGGNSTMKDTCAEICGDGRNFGTYACDDGNNINGDGCSATCTVETHWICTTGDPYTKSVCTKQCDGIRDFTDMCDDGNMISGDGCDYCCHREIGYSCSGGSLSSADTCSEACGDGRKMNILPCDDGNNLAGDGCSSTCSVETGYTCNGGTLFTADVCTEICGDGKNYGQYQCDDGNIKSDDGCSSTCFIENGFSCTAGNSTKASVCKEICGDGKNMKSYLNDCDDGNTVQGDGCSSKCLIESGFTCSQGGYYDPDICVEICGDGLNFGYNKCDDGNLQDGDGCSGYCNVEKGFVCSGGSPTGPDTCYSLSSPIINSASFNKANTQITLIFNETVMMSTTWNASNSNYWQLQMQGPLGNGNYQFSWNVTRQVLYKNQMGLGVTTMIIDFTSTSQIYGNNAERVIINFNDRSTVRSVSDKTDMVNTSAIVYPFGQDDGSAIGSSTTDLPSLIDTMTQVLTVCSYGAGFIGGLFGHSLMDVWIMMQTLQQIYLFPVNHLYVPTALTNYILNLQYAMPQSQYIGYLCFGGSTNYTQIQANNPPPTYAYIKMGFFSNTLLQTAADILSIFVYTIAINMIVEIFRLAYDESQTLDRSLMRVKSSMLFGYIPYAFMKLAFTTHLNMKHMNFSDPENTISSLLSIVIGSGLWFYMFYTGYQAFKFYKQMNILRERYPDATDDQRRDLTYFKGNILFQEYSTSAYSYPVTVFFPIFNQLKLLLTACVIISNNTQTQLQGTMLINLMSITGVMLIHPLKSQLLNLQLIFNEMAIFAIYMQAHYFIPKSTVNQTTDAQMTELVVLSIFIIVGINASIVIFNKISQVARCRTIARPRPKQEFEVEKKAVEPEKPQQSISQWFQQKMMQDGSQTNRGLMQAEPQAFLQPQVVKSTTVQTPTSTYNPFVAPQKVTTPVSLFPQTSIKAQTPSTQQSNTQRPQREPQLLDDDSYYDEEGESQEVTESQMESKTYDDEDEQSYDEQSSKRSSINEPQSNRRMRDRR